MTGTMPDMPIIRLLDGARRFDAFVRRYRAPLLHYFRRRGANPTDAEDMTQDVFLRLMRKVREEDDSVSDGYVFSAAASVMVDYHRRAQVRGTGALATALDDDLPCPAPGPDRIIEDRQSLRVIRQEILALHPKWRRAFIFHRFDQLSYAEIAQKMNVSVSSVEKYVMLALASLKRSSERDRHD